MWLSFVAFIIFPLESSDLDYIFVIVHSLRLQIFYIIFALKCP